MSSEEIDSLKTNPTQEAAERYLVYLIRNKDNGKIYIGQTSKTLEYRWYLHHYNAERRLSDFALSRAIRKYGPESFTMEVIDETDTKEEANDSEKFWIQMFSSTKSRVGYNQTYGGEGGVPTEAIREKLRARMLGPLNPQYGKRYSKSPVPVEEARALYESGWPISKLAKHFNYSHQTMSKHLKEAGVVLRTSSERLRLAAYTHNFIAHIPSNVGSHRSPEQRERMKAANGRRRRDVDDAEIAVLYESGFSTTAIARKFGMSHPAIRRRLVLNNIQLRPPGKH